MIDKNANQVIFLRELTELKMSIDVGKSFHVSSAK